jgi:hypothetical protein
VLWALWALWGLPPVQMTHSSSQVSVGQQVSMPQINESASWIRRKKTEKAKFSLTSCSNHCRERDSHFYIPPLSKGGKGCEPHPGRQIDRDGEGTKKTNQSIDFG